MQVRVGRHHRPRGLRRPGTRRQGGADPVLGPAGLNARRGNTRQGGDSAGGRTRRPQGHISRGPPAWQHPRDHRAGRPARADSRAADSSCRLERVAAAIVGGAAWRSRGQRVVVDARAVGGCRAATTRRQPRRFLARSDCRGRRCRAFIQASATKLRELQERDLSGEDAVALVLDGQDLCRVDDGRRAERCAKVDRVNATAGWRPHSWISSHACGR